MPFEHGNHLEDGHVYAADGSKLHHQLECRVAWNQTNELSPKSFGGDRPRIVNSSETIEGRVVVLIAGIRKDLTTEAFEEVRDRRLRTRLAGKELEFTVREISGQIEDCRVIES